MKNISKSLLLAALSATALTLTAQNTPEGGEGHPRRPGSPLVSSLDANHDGVIDATEIANAAAALATLDANTDGQVTLDEVRPARGEGGRGRGPGGPGGPGGPQGDAPAGAPRRPAPPLVTALDANQDGVMDASEIANAPTALATLDANADGQLSGDELRPARPDGAPEGGKGHGGKRGPRGPRPDAGQ